LSAKHLYGYLADAVLVSHFLIVLFVLAGLLAGISWLLWRRPAWAVSRGFRYSHLAAVAIIVLQSWLGVICPLTHWENALRARAGQPAYTESFIQHWLHAVLFYDAPAWVFTLIYSLFGGLVTLIWWLAARRQKLPPGRDRA
jgi:hypothetical protein